MNAKPGNAKAWFFSMPVPSDPGLLVVPLANAVIDRATELRAEYGLRTPDALQAACALALDDSIRFVTGDQDFTDIPHLTDDRIELPR